MLASLKHHSDPPSLSISSFLPFVDGLKISANTPCLPRAVSSRRVLPSAWGCECLYNKICKGHKAAKLYWRPIREAFLCLNGLVFFESKSNRMTLTVHAHVGKLLRCRLILCLARYFFAKSGLRI